MECRVFSRSYVTKLAMSIAVVGTGLGTLALANPTMAMASTQVVHKQLANAPTSADKTDTFDKLVQMFVMIHNTLTSQELAQVTNAANAANSISNATWASNILPTTAKPSALPGIKALVTMAYTNIVHPPVSNGTAQPYSALEAQVLSGVNNVNPGVTISGSDLYLFFENMKASIFSQVFSGNASSNTSTSFDAMMGIALEDAAQNTADPVTGQHVFVGWLSDIGLSVSDLPTIHTNLMAQIDDSAGANTAESAEGAILATFMHPSVTSLSLTQGETPATYTLTLQNTETGADGIAIPASWITWTSDNSSVATGTNGTGTITAVGAGSTTLYVWVHGYPVFDLPVTVAANSGNSGGNNGDMKHIILDGKTVATVPSFEKNDKTYMPVWYIMQALDSIDFSSKWDGSHWFLTAPKGTKLDFNHIGRLWGTESLYLDGRLVEKVNGYTVKDPSSNEATTYMPLWYVQQLLNRAGVTNTWDGTNWTIG